MLPASDNMLIDALAKADIVLVPAAPWDDQATLYTKTALNPECFPKFSDAVGLMSTVFLDKEGKKVGGQYSMVGLGHSGFRQAAKNDAVLLMCGGEKRRSVALSALRGKLVSVLITSSATANWLLKQNV